MECLNCGRANGWEATTGGIVCAACTPIEPRSILNMQQPESSFTPLRLRLRDVNSAVREGAGIADCEYRIGKGNTRRPRKGADARNARNCADVND